MFARKLFLIVFLIFTTLVEYYSQSISKEIVLEIPPVKITKYEYEKNLKEFIDNFQNNNKVAPSKEEIENWKNEFINKTYLLADLYSKGYNKRSDVINTVNSMAQIILTQDHGLVLNEIIDKKIIVTEDEVSTAYERGKKSIKLKYLKFPDKEIFESVIGNKDKKINNSEFDSLASNTNNHSILQDSLIFVWPYSFIGTLGNNIYNSNVGNIIYSTEDPSNISIYCTKEVANIEQKPYLEAKEDLYKLLTIRKREEAYKAFDKKVQNETKLEIDDQICDKFIELYDFEIFKIIDTTLKAQKILEQFGTIYKDKIANYYLNTKKIELSVEELLFNYSNSILLKPLSNREYLVQFIKDYVKDEYILAKADSLGFAKTDKFVLNKINYMNKTILGFYEYRDLVKKVQITDDEIIEEYNKHIENFNTAETANITVYTFDSRNNAFGGGMQLQSDKNDTSSLRGLVKQEDIILDWKTSIFPLEIASGIFDLKVGKVSSPINFGSNFLVIVKNDEKGNFVKPLDAVKGKIKISLETLKREKLKNKQTEKAKNNYSIVINNL